jgi:hypothetical protein
MRFAAGAVLIISHELGSWKMSKFYRWHSSFLYEKALGVSHFKQNIAASSRFPFRSVTHLSIPQASSWLPTFASYLFAHNML